MTAYYVASNVNHFAPFRSKVQSTKTEEINIKCQVRPTIHHVVAISYKKKAPEW